MSEFLVLAILLGSLFAVAYITKRRFGVLGLALCAGSILSIAWANSLTPWIQSQGISVVAPPLGSVVSTLLVLAPALLLLFSGPTYSSNVQRVIGSAAFAILALMFLLQPIGIALVLDSTGTDIYAALSDNSSGIIAFGIVLALGDMLMTRSSHKGKK